ncbi:binding--dependent transport system inner membrane component family protein, partial [Vibrio parahaemolyticus V-223/04]
LIKASSKRRPVWAQIRFTPLGT